MGALALVGIVALVLALRCHRMRGL
jgi:hypothetical protein